jgi:hypothetical protein
MPLAFESESHGTVAFGFFNIESDMLLLDRYFFFATDFCEAICQMVKGQGGKMAEFPIRAWVIKNPASIGDLHGGIAGTHFSGFIGETYKKYPFPTDKNKFKQQTDGFKTRDDFERIIFDFGTDIELILRPDRTKERVSIGPCVFSQKNFSQLIQYVIQGGFPRWLNGIAPDYVINMKQRYERNDFVT